MSVLPPTRKQTSKGPLSSEMKKKRKRNRKNNPQTQTSNKIRSQTPLSARTRVQQFQLSQCSRNYLRALTDPYQIESGLACIPDDNDIPSYKTLIIHRGTFNVGSLGFVFTNPWASCNNSPGAIKVTTALYVSAGVDFSAAAGVTQTALVNMPYNVATVAQGGIAGRTVGCGLRIRYTGTELNRSGRLIPFQATNVVSGAPANGSTTSVYLNRPEIPSIACDRKWHSVVYLPISGASPGGSSGPNAYAYQYSTGSDGNNNNITTNMGLGFIVDGASSGNGFEWEIWHHKEYISDDGAIVPPNTSRSHSDGPGLSAVRNAVESSLPVGDGPSYYEQALKYLQTYSPEDISHVKDVLVQGRQAYKLLTM